MSRESTTTITDKLIEPFFLTKDEYCYTLIEKVAPNKKHFRSKGKGYQKVREYFASIPSALGKILELKTHTNEEFDSLEKYINEFRTISKDLSKFKNRNIWTN